MPRYVYTGPAEQRGNVPSWGFDDGVLAPDHLAALIGRGHVRDLRASPIADEPEPDPAPAADEAKPLNRMNKAELQAAAAGLGLATDGTNRELAERIGEARR